MHKLVVGIIVSTLFASNLAWSAQSSQTQAAAQARLSHVITTFNAAAAASNKKGFEQTIEEARKIKAEFGELPAGRLAQYYIALSHENLGHTAEAIQNLEELIQSDDGTMKALALFALGSLYKNHGEAEKALEVYKQLDQGGAYIIHSGSHSKSESHH